jgi:hypothetical protein
MPFVAKISLTWKTEITMVYACGSSFLSILIAEELPFMHAAYGFRLCTEADKCLSSFEELLRELMPLSEVKTN